MYILESIQEFQGKKIGIYNLDEPIPRRKRRAIKQLKKSGTPDYAIFISEKRIKKGDHELYTNNFSFDIKTEKDKSNSVCIEIITI